MQHLALFTQVFHIHHQPTYSPHQPTSCCALSAADAARLAAYAPGAGATRAAPTHAPAAVVPHAPGAGAAALPDPPFTDRIASWLAPELPAGAARSCAAALAARADAGSCQAEDFAGFSAADIEELGVPPDAAGAARRAIQIRCHDGLWRTAVAPPRRQRSPHARLARPSRRPPRPPPPLPPPARPPSPPRLRARRAARAGQRGPPSSTSPSQLRRGGRPRTRCRRRPRWCSEEGSPRRASR
jgi:hypothetical protein